MYLKISIHPFLYILSFILLITGKIKPLLIFMSLIVVHELGHFMAAKRCGWKTEQIELYPYGGISKFQTLVNVPIRQEFFVLIMGPLAQMIVAHICSFFLSARNIEILMQYNYFLLWFNLLPIYPLDGGRLVNLILSRHLAFQKSFKVVTWISYTIILFLEMKFILRYSVFFICVLILIFLKLEKEKRQFPFIFHKFLLERILYKWNFKKKIVIQNETEMRKDTYHFFKRDQTYIKEEEYLSKKLI